MSTQEDQNPRYPQFMHEFVIGWGCRKQLTNSSQRTQWEQERPPNNANRQGNDCDVNPRDSAHIEAEHQHDSLQLGQVSYSGYTQLRGECVNFSTIMPALGKSYGLCKTDFLLWLHCIMSQESMWSNHIKELIFIKKDLVGHNDAQLSTSVTMVEDGFGFGLNWSNLLTPQKDDILCFVSLLQRSEVIINITKFMMLSLNDYVAVFYVIVNSDYSNLKSAQTQTIT